MNLRTIQVHVKRALIDEFKREAREAFPKGGSLISRTRFWGPMFPVVERIH